MTLEEFKKRFSYIEKHMEDYDRVNKGIQAVCPSSFAVIELGGHLLDEYMDLLESQFDSEGEWIAYYVFECEMGRSSKEVIIDQETILLDNVEKLYHILTS